MDLSELKFKVDTTELVSAETAVKKLGDAVDGLAKPIGELNTQAKRLGKSAEAAGKSVSESLAKPAEEAGDSLSKVEKMIQKAGLSLAVLRNQAVDTADGTFAVVDSFTKMQAGMLATAKMAGATTAQMQELASIIKQTNDITGQNPFDKSASGLAKMKQEVQELTAIMALQAQGLALTGKELQEYSRDITRVTAAMQAEGKSSEELSAALAKLKSETLQLSAEKAKLVAASKAAEEQVKREAAAALERERAEQQSIETTRRNFNYRMQFIEEQKQAEKKAYDESMQEMRKYYAEQERATRAAEDEITRQQQAREKALIQQSYVAQGNSAAASGRAAGMQMQGVPREVIDSYLAQAKVLEGASSAARKHATAVQYLTDVEARLDAQLKEGKDLREKYTDRMVKVRNAIQASGASADVAAEKLGRLESKIKAVAAKERQEELDRLARGVSVQMGDVGISLASGMNPFLVMIQQGDQIRNLLQDTKASSEELKKTMSSAFTQIATSIVATSKAIGGFFVGSLMDAGKAFAAFATQLPVLGFTARKLEEFRLKNQKLGEEGSAGYLAIANAIGVFQKAMLAVSTIPVVLAITAVTAAVVALVQAVKETDAFTRSMTLANGALGMTAVNAAQMAMSMNSVGISTSDAMKVMTEMGKTGELTGKQVQMVTKAAVDLKTYGGVAIADTVKVFADLAKDPLDALFKVAKQTGQVSYESLRLVESLKMQGKEQEAATAAMQIYADVTARQVESLKTNYTAFASFMIELGKGIKEFYSTIKDALFGAIIGQSDVEALTSKAKQLSNIQLILNSGAVDNPITKSFYENKKKQLTEEIVGLNQKFAAQESLRKQEEADIDLQKKAAKYREENLTREEKYIRTVLRLREEKSRMRPEDQQAVDLEIAAEAKKYGEELDKAANKRERLTDAEKEAKKLQEEIKRAQETYNDILGKSSGLNADYNNKVNDLNLLIKQGKINQSEYTEAFLKLVAAQPVMIDRTREAKSAQDEYNRVTELGLSLMGKSEGLGKEYYDSLDRLNKALLSSDSAERTNFLLQAIDALKQTTPAARATASALVDLQELHKSLTNETYNLAQAQEDERYELVFGAEATKRMIALRKIDLEYVKDITAALKIKAAAEAKGGQVNDAALQAAIDAANAKRDTLIRGLDTDVNSFVANLRKTLPDVIYDAFTGKGKSAAKKLRDMLVEELVKKPITVYIKAVTDVVANSVGGLFGQNGSGFDFGKMIKTGTEAFNGMKSFFGGSTTGTTTAGASAGGASGLFSSANFYTALAYAAYNRGSSEYDQGFTSKQADLNKNRMFGEDAIGQSVSRLSVDNLLYKMGTKWFGMNDKTASILSGKTAIGQLIGRGAARLEGTNISGTIDQSGFSGSMNNRFRQKGGLFRSDKVTMMQSALEPDVAKAIGQSTSAAKASMIEYAKSLGLNADSVANSVRKFDADITGLSNEEAIKKIEEEISNYTESLAEEFAPAMERFRNLGETSTETLTRLATTLSDTNEVLGLLGHTLFSTSLASADFAQALVDEFGDLSTFVQTTSGYYESFYTEAERANKATQMLSDSLKEVGVSSIPKTREEYRALVESQDLTTESGRKTYAALIKMSGVFDELNPKLDTLAGKFGTLIGTMFDDALEQIDAQISASQRAADQARRVAQEYFDISDALREYANGLTGGSESSNYRSVLAAAQGGDIGAMQNLQGAAQDFIESAKATSTSTEEYNQRVAQVQQELLQVAALAGTQGSAAEYQSQLLDINTELLEELKASIETQNVTVDLLNEQLAALETVGELITASANLTVAQSITNTGELKTGLVDNAGNVVASIDSTTAAQLAAIAAQTASVTSNGTASANTVASVIGSESTAQLAAIAAQTSSVTANSTTNATGISASVTNAATGQTVSFGNIIGSQTSAYAGLSADQIAALANVEEVGAENADYAASIAALTNTNNAVLDAVLSSLDSDSTSFAQLTAAVTSGNDSIRTVLNNILLQLQVNGNVPGSDQGFVGPVQTGAQAQLAAAQALLVQIRDTALPGINSAQVERDAFAQAVQDAYDEALATGDYRTFNQLNDQLFVYDARLQELTDALQRDLEAQRQIIIGLGGVPAFASGGMHSGGMRLVGENGPELEVTGPSRIFNASQTAAMLRGGDNSELLEVLISKVEMLEAAARSSAVSNNKVAKILDRVSPDGNSLQITTAV